MIVDIVEKHRVFRKYAEMYVENLVSSIIADVERYSWTAMAVLSVTKLSVLRLYLLHDKFFSTSDSVESAITIRSW